MEISESFADPSPLRSVPQYETTDFFTDFSASNFFTDEDGFALPDEDPLYTGSLILVYLPLRVAYNKSVSRLQELTEEVYALRKKNDELRLANMELMRMKLLSYSHPPRSLSYDFSGLDMGGIDGRVAGKVSDVSLEHNRGERRVPKESDFDPLHLGGIDSRVTEIYDVSPISVIKYNPNPGERRSAETVYSSGYLKMNQHGRDGVGPSRSATSPRRVPSPVPNESQRMHVPRGKEEEDAREFEAYNQGMKKTELCNNWLETGACYDDQCQFAHGIKELRLVIKHHGSGSSHPR